MKDSIFRAVILLGVCALVSAACMPVATVAPATPTPGPSDTPPRPTQPVPTQVTQPSLTIAENGIGGKGKPAVEITFICNEGFMLTSSRGEKILVDALQTGLAKYGTLSPEQRRQMEQALPPFDQVNLILNTHNHPDHFDAELIKKHMQSNAKAVFVSTGSSLAGLKELFPNRVTVLEVSRGGREKFTANGFQIEALGLRHSQSDYAHVGYVFSLGGRRILHMGDAEDTGKLPSDLGEIDVAFYPYWVTPPQAKQTIKMHLELPSPYAPGQKWVVE